MDQLYDFDVQHEAQRVGIVGDCTATVVDMTTWKVLYTLHSSLQITHDMVRIAALD